nr:thiamine diphosphokinase [Alkalibacterium sp. AK22]
MLGSPEMDKLRLDLRPGDKVVGVDKGALMLLDEGVSVDLAIGDFDSVSEAEYEKITREAREYRRFEAEKDDTDAELAIEWAEKRYKPDKLFVYNWSGGRMDHLLNLLFLVHQPRFEDIIQKIEFKHSQNNVTFYKAGSYHLDRQKNMKYLAFVGMTALKGLSTTGVKYPVDRLDTAYPVTLISNEFTQEYSRFSFSEGVLAVIQSSG